MWNDEDGIVLITGGSGFIGCHLNKFLRNRYHTISLSSKEFEIRREREFEKLKAENIRHVIHLAGKTFVPESWENPHTFYDTNITGTLNVVEFCRKNKIGMTYISAYIYGQPESNLISETAAANPNNPYAQSKYLAEQLCRFYCENFEMDITILRLFNVFGPRQKKHFLIPYILKQILGESDTVNVQDLAPKRDYIYIDDVCKVIELSIKKTDGYQLYNIGSGRSYSVGEVIAMAQKIAGTDKTVISKNDVRRHELNDVIADISLIRSEWGWEPVVSLETGLARCMEENR